MGIARTNKDKAGVLILIFFMLMLAGIVPGTAQQSRTDLEDRRKQLLEEIDENNELLASIKKDKETKLKRFYALQSQIRKRKELVNTLREELSYADAAIVRVDDVIAALAIDIDRLKVEYAQMLRIAYRHRLSGNFLSFLFSARSFNDAFRRWQYLRQYDRYRKRQAQLIIETQEELAQRSEQLEEERREKENLLTSAEEQQVLLANEMGMMNELIANLKKDESKVAAELKEQQADHQKLNDLIEKVIFNEMAKERKEARKPEALQADKKETAKPAAAVPAIDAAGFVKNKGHLPWPVRNGVITRYFGTQAHPTIKSVEITNNGVDISTDARSEVRAVFSGEVVGVQYVPGYKNTLILQHGPYYTVYSNMDEADVERGDIVAAGQAIGRMGDTAAELHFEVWREKQKLNPIHWIEKQ